MIVVDASAIVDLLANTGRARGVRTHLERSAALAAPDLLHSEVLSGIARLVRADTLSESDADLATVALSRLAVQVIPMKSLLGRAWSLQKERLRVTDAFYVASAEALGCPLLTTDLRLARGVRGLTVMTVG